MNRLTTLVAGAALALAAAETLCKDWYVSAETGRGRSGTKEKPAKDLAAIVNKLEPGDRVFIAAGVYTSRGDQGSDIIKVPVELIGGWDTSFSTRDPWGATPTVLSGDNGSSNWKGTPRLGFDLSKYRANEPHTVVVDGFVIDNADRNRYNDDNTAIIRKASPALGKMPTPESGAVVVRCGKETDVVVRNVIAINTAPTGGVIGISASMNSDVLIENNLVVNNTGDAFGLTTAWRPRDGETGLARFTVRQNTALFSQKHDPIATFGGAAVKLEADMIVDITGNVFAFSDRYTIDNARQAKAVVCNDNLWGPSAGEDYVEFDTDMPFDEIEDYAEHFDEFEGNHRGTPEFAVPPEWLEVYLARNVADRNAVEAGVSVADTWENAARSILGKNVQGSSIGEVSASWLPRLDRDAVLEAAASLRGDRGAAFPSGL